MERNTELGRPVEDRHTQQEEAAWLRFMRATAENGGVTESKRRIIPGRRVTVNERDSNAIERILGNSDLFPISYLQVGLRVSEPVCRVVLRDRRGAVEGSGTGFLVAPNVLLTNNHVINDTEVALRAHVEFNYQDDENFMPQPVYSFRLDPQSLFLTDEELDFTFVAVHDNPRAAKSLAEFGHLPLVPERGKVIEGEYVSIIQHPSGGPKAVTLRENEVRAISGDFVHYLTDTEPGSSGSPVFNDQWAVVALHHAGVPDKERPGQWLANEGVRISSIAAFVRQASPKLAPRAQELLRTVFPSATMPAEPEPEPATHSVLGYDEHFLGEQYPVPLPTVPEALVDDITVTDAGSKVLDYVHFSVVMRASRGLAFFTAVNIDGSQEVKIDRARDEWKYDERIPQAAQYGNEVYAANKLDRGHLVRRQDPNWGPDAHRANADTFHFTNCAPQHMGLNQKTWLDLEDYILSNANQLDLKVSVFTGPVFRSDDMVYRGKYRIPAEFWKVAVLVKPDGQLSATAYLQTQKHLFADLEFAYGQYRTYQIPIAQLAEITGLGFGDLATYDPAARHESLGHVINGPDDLLL